MTQSPRLSRDDVHDAALARLDAVAVECIGARTGKGRGNEWRWSGKKSTIGTLTMNATNGRWHSKTDGTGGDVFDLWAIHRMGLSRAADDFPAVLASLGDFLGLAPALDPVQREQERKAQDAARAAREAAQAKAAADEQAKRAAALACLVRASVPLADTPGAAYLTGRGITAPVPDDFAAYIPAGAIPKYTPGLIAPDAGALVVWARDTLGGIVGAQRVLISDDGKKAPIETDEGRAAKFTTAQGDHALIALPRRADDVTGGALVVVEGPEGAAAVWQCSGAETWAVFGASGWAGLVDLLPRDRRVILCPDADAIGSQAWRAFQSALTAMIGAGIDCHIAETPAIYGPKADLLDAMERDGPGAVLDALNGARAGGASSFAASPPNDQRDVIGAAMRDYIRGWINSNMGDDKPRNALVRGSQGLGKSTAARGALVDMYRGTALAAYPTKEKALEEYSAYCAEKLPFSPRPVLYRARDAARGDGGEGPMCERHAEAAEMIAHALEPGALCEDCPFRVGCPYREQSAMLAKNQAAGVPMVIFSPHELAFERAPFAPDFAIIDEMPARGVVRATRNIRLDDFALNKGSMANGLHLKDDADPVAVGKVLSSVGGALCDLATAGEVLAPMRDAIGETRKAIYRAPHFDPEPDDTAASIRRKVEGFRYDYAKGRRIRSALAAVLVDLDAGFTALQSISGGPLLWTATRIASPRIDCPILALDGTASPLLSRAWLGDFEDKAFRVERDAEVIQVVGKSYSTQSLTGEMGKFQHATPDDKARFQADAARLRGQLVKVIQGQKSAGFVAAKDVREALKTALPDTVEKAHFNALRGLNSLERCEVIYIIGRVQPPAREIGRIAGAYGAALGFKVNTTADYIDVTRRLRMRDGSTHPVEVQAYPDAVGDEVLRQIRDGEIEQAADRCRPIFNKRRIVILSKTCCDFTVDRVTSHRDLMDGGNRFERAFMASGGMLRLSAAGMAADASEIFGTANAAKVWQRKQLFGERFPDFLNGVLSQISILFGDRPHLIPSHVCSVKIRLKGQRGKLTPALVLAEKENAEAAAVEAWGDLDAFELVAVNGVPVEVEKAPGGDPVTAQIITLSRSLEASGVLREPGVIQCRIIAKASAETGTDAAAVAARLGINHCNFNERGAA